MNEALVAPTCTFIGGPWDGRRHHYVNLYSEFFIPDNENVASMVMNNEALTHYKSYVNVHVYRRGSVVQQVGEPVQARYFYQGLRT